MIENQFPGSRFVSGVLFGNCCAFLYHNTVSWWPFCHRCAVRQLPSIFISNHCSAIADVSPIPPIHDWALATTIASDGLQIHQSDY